jgi:hypothetical protein
MNKIIFTMRANTAHHVFDYSYATLDYVFRMYTPEQKSKFFTQQQYCEAQGWLDPVPVYDLDDVESVQQAHTVPTSNVFVDLNNNSFTHVFTGNDLQAMWDYFVLDHRNFEPMVAHYAANPGEGELTATLMYGSIPQAIDVASLYD